MFYQEDHPCVVSDGPTKRPQHMRISGLISQTYLRPIFELLNKLSTTVFCSKRLMHFQTLLNIYKFAASTTFRFVLRSVHQVKGDFILILALASNHLSVCVCVCVSCMSCMDSAGCAGRNGAKRIERLGRWGRSGCQRESKHLT